MTRSECEAIVDAGLVLAADMGWDGFSWPELAQHSKIELERLWLICPSRSALLAHIVVYMSEAVRREALQDMDHPKSQISPRELVTDVLVRGFEWLEPAHSGFRNIWLAHLGSSVAICSAAALLPVVKQELRKISNLTLQSRGGIGDTLLNFWLLGLIFKAAHRFAMQEVPNIEPIMADLDRGTLRIWQLLDRIGFSESSRPQAFEPRGTSGQ